MVADSDNRAVWRAIDLAVARGAIGVAIAARCAILYRIRCRQLSAESPASPSAKYRLARLGSTDWRALVLAKEDCEGTEAHSGRDNRGVSAKRCACSRLVWTARPAQPPTC